MISLTEAKSAMVRKVDGRTTGIVKGCSDGVGESGNDNFDMWLETGV
jgi:hypothetical protein